MLFTVSTVLSSGTQLLEAASKREIPNVVSEPTSAGMYCSPISTGTLGWEPAVKLREGLAKSLEYYREHAGLYW